MKRSVQTLCWLLLCAQVGLFAQLGRPYQQYYSPKEYKAHQLIWGMVQDSRGIIYAANNDGVLSYDGQHWQTISTPNPVRSLAIDRNNRLFVGCKGEFGVLKIDSVGRLFYTSIRKLLPKQDQMLAKDFDKTYCTEEATWFVSEFMLVRATESGGLFNLTTWKFEQDGLTGAGLLGGKLLVHRRGTGLCEATTGGLKLAPDGAVFKDKEITAIKNAGNESLIATASNGIFKYNGSQTTLLTTAIDNILKKNIIYELAVLPSSNQLAVATMSGGVYVISLSGQLIYTFTKETGFPDNDIYCVYTDKQSGLWIAHSKGLARIGLNIPIVQLPGVEGKVAAIISFGGRIYVATSQGIFEKNESSFRMLPGVNTECRSLHIFNGKLYAASNKGLLEITAGAVRFVLPNELCLSVGSSAKNKKLLVGHFKGIWAIDPATGQKTDVPGVTEESFSFCETSTGEIWVGTSYQGVISLKPNGENFTATKMGANDGLPEGKVEPRLINGTLIFKTESGFFEQSGDKFVPLTNLNAVVFGKNNDLIQGAKDNLWVVQESGVFLVEGAWKTEPKINPISPANILQEKPTVFYVDDQNIQWIAINDQVFRLDNSHMSISNTGLTPVITKVTAAGKTIFSGYFKTDDEKASTTQTPKFIPELQFSQNSLSIEVGTPSFENEKGTQFQFFLEGNDSEWSSWSKEPKVTYTNLSAGNYSLRIHSKNSYGAISQEITYSFKIYPPWYLTWWAYLCYFLLFTLIVYIVVRAYSQRLVAANIKLEQTVSERTREIAKQKEEIEKQKVEVEKSRDLLEDKNKAIQEAYNKLQNTQAQLIQSEKMASLGQLIAGVAHEINTPIGAINASTGNIDKSLPIILQKLPILIRDMDSTKEQLFFQLIERMMSTTGSLTSREERQYKKTVTELLENHQVENADSLAPQLVKIGLIENLEPFLLIFKDPKSAELIETATVIGKLRLNLDNIKLAIAKTQKIVFALKSYSHRQSDDAFAQASIIENMETVLTIYQNQLKYGIEVHTEFDETVPLIWCLADELNQVWTNIIHNAIQAMENKGTLDISIQRFGTVIVTKITDSGPGIPQDILTKIFDPFFTTKRQGEGSGLGLDICRKIIQKHQGNISVESQPGKTTFIIELPILDAPPQLKTI